MFPDAPALGAALLRVLVPGALQTIQRCTEMPSNALKPPASTARGWSQALEAAFTRCVSLEKSSTLQTLSSFLKDEIQLEDKKHLIKCPRNILLQTLGIEPKGMSHAKPVLFRWATPTAKMIFENKRGGSHYGIQAGLIVILLPLLPQCWEHKHGPTHLASILFLKFSFLTMWAGICQAFQLLEECGGKTS